MNAAELTPDEVKAFADKLEAFGGELTPVERALLAEILARAAAATESKGALVRGVAAEATPVGDDQHPSPQRALLRDITGL